MIKRTPITAIRAAGTPLRRYQQKVDRATVRLDSKKRLPLTQYEVQQTAAAAGHGPVPTPPPIKIPSGQAKK